MARDFEDIFRLDDLSDDDLRAQRARRKQNDGRDGESIHFHSPGLRMIS